MQRHKSRRHQHAANTRWREERAQAERDAGIPDRQPEVDGRSVRYLDLRDYGGPLVRAEPRLGYCSCRFFDDETGELLACCTMKQALIELSRKLPPLRRMDGA